MYLTTLIKMLENGKCNALNINNLGGVRNK